MDDLSLLTLAWLFLLALVAGIIDAMAGGGGLLTVPGLMATGLDPVAVFATNKLQGTFGSLSATVHFWRKGKIKFREHLWPATLAFLGSIGGAFSLSYIEPELLKFIVPFMLIAIALWVLFSPTLGALPRNARISHTVCALTFIPAIGYYDGFFGPGTGTFFAMGLVSLLGLTLNEATVRAKIYNLASNLGALSFFLFSGHIVWIYGGVMLVGMIIGGNLGARLILKHGSKLIKPVLVSMSLAMSVKLLWQQAAVHFDN
ncbi:MAG: TSUP family transporter [Methylococcales bacterium]|nr:TSUP family transporter [Methylococcaceae bacterium]